MIAKKSSTPIAIAILIFLILALYGFALIKFMSIENNFNSDIQDYKILDSVYVKEDLMNFYLSKGISLNDAMSLVKEISVGSNNHFVVLKKVSVNIGKSSRQFAASYNFQLKEAVLNNPALLNPLLICDSTKGDKIVGKIKIPGMYLLYGENSLSSFLFDLTRNSLSLNNILIGQIQNNQISISNSFLFVSDDFRKSISEFPSLDLVRSIQNSYIVKDNTNKEYNLCKKKEDTEKDKKDLVDYLTSKGLVSFSSPIKLVFINGVDDVAILSWNVKERKAYLELHPNGEDLTVSEKLSGKDFLNYLGQKNKNLVESDMYAEDIVILQNLLDSGTTPAFFNEINYFLSNKRGYLDLGVVKINKEVENSKLSDLFFETDNIYDFT